MEIEVGSVFGRAGRCDQLTASALVDPRQLLLPLPGSGPVSATSRGIPRADRVFVNRDLRFSSIDWIGFDMDYTLAIYRQEEMDSLSVELMVERMIKRGYPAT